MTNAYAETFERFAAALPQPERESRAARFAEFQARGFPSKREEDWRYTDLAALSDRSYALAAVAAPAVTIDAIDGTDRLVFIDGRLDPAQSRTDYAGPPGSFASTSTATDGLRSLNVAFAEAGLNLELAPKACLERPLHLILAGNASGSAVMNHQRHRIALGESAEATVIVEFAGLQDGDRFSTQVIEIALAANAKLDLYRVQRESAGTTLLVRVDAQLARDSRLQAVCIDGGHGLARQDFNVALQGPGADAKIDGLYIANSGAHIDNHARVIHEQPQGRSRAHFRGMVQERARAVLNGKVVVRPGAQKTDSELRIATLLLSRRAEVNAKPDLEIYADDVKCAHGLTVGQLDDGALEYLRSRGIVEAEARALLLRAFAAATLGQIKFAPLRRHVEALMNFPHEATDELPGDFEPLPDSGAGT